MLCFFVQAQTIYKKRRRRNSWGWRSQKFREIRRAFPQTVTVLFKRRLCVLFRHTLSQKLHLPQAPETSSSLSTHPCRHCIQYPAVKAGFHTFNLAFIVTSGCFGAKIWKRRITSLSPPCLSLKISRLLPFSTSLDNFLVTFYSDPPRHSTRGFLSPTHE